MKRLVLALPILLAACSPSLSPLYSDYSVPKAVAPATVEADIAAALTEAGWTVDSSATEVLATQPRGFGNWGLYRVVVSLEVASFGDGYVRVLVHPYRHYFTGNRSKIPFLSGSLRRAVLNDVTEALENRGLTLEGNANSRDNAAVVR